MNPAEPRVSRRRGHRTMARPCIGRESRDIDLYQFRVTEAGVFRAETIAERLAVNSNLLNTVADSCTKKRNRRHGETRRSLPATTTITATIRTRNCGSSRECTTSAVTASATPNSIRRFRQRLRRAGRRARTT